MTTSHNTHDWDTFISALAATTAQIPDETSSVAWGAPGGPEFVTTRSGDGQFAVIVDATVFPDAIAPYLPPEAGWFIPSNDPAEDSTFALVRSTPQELAHEVFGMLTEWAQISDPSMFLSPEGVQSNHDESDDERFTGRELGSGIELRDEFESLFSQLDIPAFSGVAPGAYIVYVSDVTVDLYIDESVPSIQLQAEVRRDIPDVVDGLNLANEANTIATFARFHYEHERDRVLATWHLSQSFYTSRALLQGIFGFASAVYTVADVIPSSAPGTTVEWTVPVAD